MKKFVFSLFVLLGMAGVVSAQDVTLSVDDVEALKGEEITATLNFSCPADIYTGMQIWLEFPFEYSVVEGTAVQGFNGLVDTKVMSDNRLKFSASSGSEFTSSKVNVTFTVGSDVELTDYEVKITGQLEGTDPEDENLSIVTPVSGTFKVKIVNAHSVVLDENATEAPAAAEGVNVTVNRTIKADEWSTICLPFAVSSEKMTSTFGEGVELADFIGCDATTDDEENVTAINVKFNTVDAIEANHPYIIKVKSELTKFEVEGVDIVVEEEPSVDKDEYRTGSGTKKDPYVCHYNSFVGTYVAETEVADQCLFLSENKFWYSTGNTKMKAFRGYFDLYDVLTAVEEAGSRMKMSFGDTTTGISNVKYQINGEYYNLNGLRVETPAKGVFIKDGKKVVVK